MKKLLSRKSSFLIFLAVLYSIGSLEIQANTIKVPSEQQSIQAAINAAHDGDTVLVAPGTYRENINFAGKGITVKSEAGPGVTIIDGNRSGSVVTFDPADTAMAELSGFRIQNGRSLEGGGIFIRFTSPVIRNNIVIDNEAPVGGGISISFGSPIIQSNTITRNEAGMGGGVGGGGIFIGGGSAHILDNVISDNSLIGAAGGGIGMFGTGAPLIRGNIISRNVGFSQGGGISMVNSSNALIIQNLITDNIAATEFRTNRGGRGQGGGIYWLAPNDFSSPQIVNNTIVNNDGAEGSGLYIEGFKSHTTIMSNIIMSKKKQIAFFCGGIFNLTPPIFKFNNVFSKKGTTYAGILPDQTGINGNISADPSFADLEQNDYHLTSGSPCIEAGDNDAAGLSDIDVAGALRIVDGNGDGSAVIDIGAYEKQGPRITDVTTEGKNLLITGANFDDKSVILMNGARQKTLRKNQNELTGKKLRNKIDAGQTVNLQVRDSDGALSPEFSFTLP